MLVLPLFVFPVVGLFRTMWRRLTSAGGGSGWRRTAWAVVLGMILPLSMVATESLPSFSFQTFSGDTSAATMWVPRSEYLPQPWHATADSAGNLYITGLGLYKLSPSGALTDLLANATNRPTSSALRGVAVGKTGRVFCADWGANVIWVLEPDGTLKVLAGSSDFGWVDGTGGSARFWGVMGLAIDTDDNLYVADQMNGAVRKVTSAGVVTTVYHAPVNTSWVPDAIAVDTAGQLLVTTTNCLIYKLSPQGELSYWMGNIAPGATDGAAAVASFQAMRGLAIAVDGTVYVADSGNCSVRKISPSGVVSTLAGLSRYSGSTDGVGTQARFYNPTDVLVASDGSLLVVDQSGGQIRRVTQDGTVTTVYGDSQAHYADGPAARARFDLVQGLAFDANGDLLVVDQTSMIRRVRPEGSATTIAGTGRWVEGLYYPTMPVYLDGTAASARFRWPSGVVADAAGNVYIADTGNSVIRKLSTDGTVSTLAGVATTLQQHGDGQGSGAGFYQPWQMAIDTAGNLYVADSGNHSIRKITPSGLVTTLAGAYDQAGAVDGVGSAAHFRTPYGVALSADGSIYVADTGNYTIRRIDASFKVTTVAGQAGTYGTADGLGTAARFQYPTALAFDRAGNLYVRDSDAVRMIDATGLVTTLVGRGAAFGYEASSQALTRLSTTGGLAVDASGNLYVGDGLVLRKGTRTTTLAPVSPKLQWTQPAAIHYGEALSALELCATANVAGTYVYSLPLGTLLTVGTYELSVTFTPNDTVNYVSESARVSLQVLKAEPVITWDTPAAMTYGSPLSATQLNATVNVPGTFTYTPPAGTVLGLGRTTVTAMFTPTDTNNYAVVQKSLNVQVGLTNYAGVYFGSFTENGSTWAMFVKADGSGTFLSYIASRNSLCCWTAAVDSAGAFTASGEELGALGGAATAQALSVPGTEIGPASVSQLQGQISSAGKVSGTFAGGALTLSGYRDGATGISEAMVGLYSAPTADGSGLAYMIVGGTGQAQVAVRASGLVDGGRITIVRTGALPGMTTTAGNYLTGSIDPTLRTMFLEAVKSGATTAVLFGQAPAAQASALLSNISTRAFCRVGNGVTIGGFVVAGTGTKRVLVRAVGPSLTASGLAAAEVLADPTIEVHDASNGNQKIAENDNWADANAALVTSTAKTVGATALEATDTRSSALVLDIAPGVYSFVAKGVADTEGIVLVEVYDADTTTGTARLSNIATRAYATTGNGVTIGGFVIAGSTSKKVLLRAIGPTLTTQQLDISEVLADPMIEVYSSSTGLKIAANDNWTDTSNAAAIVAVGARIGATPMDAKDTTSAAFLQSMQPGVYSFVVSGGGTNRSGIVLLEVYDAD